MMDPGRTHQDESQDRWERRIGAVIIWIAGVMFCVFMAFGIRGGGEAAWRLAGGFLELSGLVMGVGVRFKKWIDATGARTPVEWLRHRGRRALRVLRRAWRWVRERLGREPEPEEQVVSVGTATETSSAGPVGVSKSPRRAPDLEERVERLEEQVSLLRRRIGEVQAGAHRRAKRLERRLRSVRNNLHDADKRLRQEMEGKVREAAVGSLRWEYVALAWFVLGVLATTWAGVLPEPPVPG